MKLYLSGELKKNELTGIFWMIDPRTNTYTAIRLSGNDRADTNRVVRLLQNRGQAMSAANIGARLAAERTSAEAKQERMKKAKKAGNREEFVFNYPCPPSVSHAEPVSQHGPFVDENAGGQWSQTCDGWGWSSIQNGNWRFKRFHG